MRPLCMPTGSLVVIGRFFRRSIWNLVAAAAGRTLTKIIGFNYICWNRLFHADVWISRGVAETRQDLDVYPTGMCR